MQHTQEDESYNSTYGRVDEHDSAWGESCVEGTRCDDVSRQFNAVVFDLRGGVVELFNSRLAKQTSHWLQLLQLLLALLGKK